MALADVSFYKSGVFGTPGAKPHQVAASAGAPAINAGELVNKTLGTQYVITCPTNGQAVATNFMAGISATTSTETTTADGSVDVFPITPGTIWMIAPTTAATWNTQTKYNNLVGARVLIAKSTSGNTGIYTIGASDSSTSGCVVENINIVKYPGKVAFSFRQALSYTA